ncbi:MAG TPA: helical backbone metal receptor [Coriobacteriia bacterium]
MFKAWHGRAARLAGTGLVITAALLAAVALSGCSAPTAAPAPAPEATSTPPVTDLSIFPLTVTDDSYREVTFTVPAARIVSLAPANTEIVYALGLFDRMVGVTTYDDYPAEVANVTKVGDFTTPNLEAIAAAKPDLILVTGGVQADVLGKLQGLGAKVLVIDPKDLDGVLNGIDIVSKALGVPAKGAEVVAKMRSDLAYIRTAVSAEPTVTAFVEIGWNPLYTAGPGTLLDDLLTAAGGANVVTQKGYVGYSVEQLLKDQPSFYLGTLGSIGDTSTVATRPGYSGLSAVKDGKVFSLDDNLVSRPGPRIIEGVREIAEILHPDVFR